MMRGWDPHPTLPVRTPLHGRSAHPHIQIGSSSLEDLIEDIIGYNSEKQFNNQLLFSIVIEVSILVSEKVMRFQGKNKDLNQLSQQIVQQLESEGYKTQSTTAPLGIVIQAKKAGILRDIITADRAFSILITGQPNDFSIHIGIGKWIQNLAVAAAEVILLSWLFLAVDVPEMLWTRHVENTIAKEITQVVG
jgi:hypothetical protein